MAAITPPPSSAYSPVQRHGLRHTWQTVTQNSKYNQWLLGYLFIIPTFIFLIYFLYTPAITALIGGFTRWDGFNPPVFEGFRNFERAFNDPVLRTAFGNNLIWAVCGILLATVPQFIVAELIFFVRNRGMQYIFRTLLIFNIVIPNIVAILIWTYFYRSDGFINQVLGALGREDWQQLWLANPRIALFSLIFMGFPWINAVNTLILYAGLQGISAEVFEAAALDGATGFRRVFLIDIPLVLPQFKLLIILSIIASVQNILSPLLMTGGGPGNATTMPILHMYRTAINYGQYGYSMAISFLLFLLVLALTLINMRFIRTNQDEGR